MEEEEEGRSAYLQFSPPCQFDDFYDSAWLSVVLLVCPCGFWNDLTSPLLAGNRRVIKAMERTEAACAGSASGSVVMLLMAVVVVGVPAADLGEACPGSGWINRDGADNWLPSFSEEVTIPSEHVPSATVLTWADLRKEARKDDLELPQDGLPLPILTCRTRDVPLPAREDLQPLLHDGSAVPSLQREPPDTDHHEALDNTTSSERVESGGELTEEDVKKSSVLEDVIAALVFLFVGAVLVLIKSRVFRLTKKKQLQEMDVESQETLVDETII
ncbi:hypothetical protein O3P69_005891 [Scylla paramamosain]|uniref:Uncharacterized protein n=1 Tax=Scylla paramamosain TaxID=85552 RepID=A0AAW0U5A7_SCYPA